MPADPAVKVNIGGDASGLISAIEQSKQAVSNFGSAAANILERKLGLKDVFKGVLQGVGIASVNQIAEKLTVPFKEAAESAQKIEQYTARAADATERLIKARQNDNQQLATAIKQMERFQKEAERAANAPTSKKFFGLIERGSGIDKLFGFSAREDAKKQEAIAENTALAAEKAVEIEQKKSQIKAKNDSDELRGLREIASEDEKRKASKEKLAEFEKQRAMEKMDADQKLSTLAVDKAKIDQQIAKYAEFTRAGGELTNQGQEELLALKNKQLDLEKEIAVVTKDKANAEKLIGETIVSNTAEWQKFKATITTTGKGDKELSDRELERKIQNIKQALFVSEVNRVGRVGVGNERGEDPFGFINANNLAQAQAELALRQKVRSFTASFGEERAFKMLPGVSEQRFSEINNTSTQLDKISNTLEKFSQQFNKGIPVVYQGGDT